MRWFGRRGRYEREMEDELRFHVERQTADYTSQGIPPAEARRRALSEFGGTELAKEECRELWLRSTAGALARDLRFAVRMLLRNPVVTAIAILSLGLGVGANTAIFSVFDALMLR